jgi:hypothetical protein
MIIYVLIGDIADDAEEPFDKEKLEGSFSSLEQVQLYITECVSQQSSFQWEPIVSFEHVPYLETNGFRVYLTTLDEGSWRSFGKIVLAGTVDDKGDVNVNTPAEVARLSGIFAEALGLTVQEFSERY